MWSTGTKYPWSCSTHSHTSLYPACVSFCLRAASNSFTIIHDPHIYTAETDVYTHTHTHTHTHRCSFPSCATAPRPCILMALMMLHAALEPLEVNFATSEVFRLRGTLTDRLRERERGRGWSIQFMRESAQQSTYCFTHTHTYARILCNISSSSCLAHPH